MPYIKIFRDGLGLGLREQRGSVSLSRRVCRCVPCVDTGRGWWNYSGRAQQNTSRGLQHVPAYTLPETTEAENAPELGK